jgi:hypothetical protein
MAFVLFDKRKKCVCLMFDVCFVFAAVSERFCECYRQSFLQYLFALEMAAAGAALSAL